LKSILTVLKLDPLLWGVTVS